MIIRSATNMSVRPIFSLISSSLPVYFTPALVDIISKYFCGEDSIDTSSNFGSVYKFEERFYYAPVMSFSGKYNLEKEKIYECVPFMYFVYLCKINVNKCQNFIQLRSKIQRRFNKCSNSACNKKGKEIISYGIDKYTLKPVCYCYSCRIFYARWHYNPEKIPNTRLYKGSTEMNYPHVIILYNINGRGDGEWIMASNFGA